MNAHTPAPWTVVDRRTDGDIVSLDVCHEGQRLARVTLLTHSPHLANAHLMAAAPDLLSTSEELNDAVEAYLAGPPHISLMNALTDALRKSRVAANKARGQGVGALLAEAAR
jgi:hypothetical protein